MSVMPPRSSRPKHPAALPSRLTGGIRAAALIAAVGLALTACEASGRSAPTSVAADQPSPLVDPSKIIGGGPPPDGIPPIDHPKFLDTVGGVPLTVTYCPLCNTGIAFRRPTAGGRLLDFGTSGKVYNSNLLMYDRETKSLWAQALGEAVVGPLSGMKLELVPAQMVAWGDWLLANPHGKVLSRDTGAGRPYGRNPYTGYDAPGSRPFLFTGTLDPRLPATARVVGVQVGPDIEALPYDSLSSQRVGGWAVVQTVVGGRNMAVFWKAGTLSALDSSIIADSRDVGSTGVFDRELSGRLLSFHAAPLGIVDDQTGSRWDIFGRAVAGPLAGQSLDRVISIESFWFDWAAFHPDTKIYGR